MISGGGAIVIGVAEGVEGLIFDIDGTLADSMPVHYEAWKQAAARQGLDYPVDLFYEFAGTPTHKIVPLINERLGCSLDVEQTTDEKERLFLDMIHMVRPIEPVVGIVKAYHGKLPMSLGTGGTRDIALMTVRAIGLEGYFGILVASEDVERHKPHPDTFLECARLMGVRPERCQVFEDGERGLDAARRAGMIATDVRPWL